MHRIHGENTTVSYLTKSLRVRVSGTTDLSTTTLALSVCYQDGRTLHVEMQG
jgi:hypothetical protein